MPHKSYLCEHCGQHPAKYEARSTRRGKNILICSDCLHELHVTDQEVTLFEQAISNHTTHHESPDHPHA